MDGPLWTDARDALASVAELSRQSGGEGLDIYCLNSDERQRDLHVSPVLFNPPKPQTESEFLTQGESGICQFFNNLIPEGLFRHGLSPLVRRSRYYYRSDADRRQAERGPGAYTHRGSKIRLSTTSRSAFSSSRMASPVSTSSSHFGPRRN
jgi:hypothetical protein